MGVCLLYLWLGSLLPLTSCLSSVSYKMREELPPDTVIGNIKQDAALEDEFPSADVDRMVFSILTPVDGSVTNGHYFKVSETTGVLRVRQPLDRDLDNVCAFRKRCVVTFDVAVGPEDLFRVITVSIEVQDINDNAPTFGLSEINLNISELASIGSSYQLPVVSDPDGDDFGVSKMSVSPATGQFAARWMRSSDGRVVPRLELLKTLDREEVTTFDLTVTATDGGSPPRSAILLVHVDVLDANDNIPAFKEPTYEVRIQEDHGTGSRLITLKAEDQDSGSNGHVVYRLGDSTAEHYGQLFRISEITGEITLISSLDREKQDVYYLTVIASDLGEDNRESSATVTVFVDDINDNAPIIRISTLTDSDVAHLLESAPEGTFVALLTVKDPDWGRNADVTCSLNGDEFRLEALQANQFKIVNGVPIDRERKSTYTVHVFCHDRGFPQKSSAAMLTVEIDDINDNAPIFRSSDVTIHITENSQPGSVIGQMTAIDADAEENGRVSYLMSEEYRNYLAVAEDTGVLSTVVSLDREMMERFVVYVTASDNGKPPLSSTATVTVIVDDVNDVIPAFASSSYTFVVVENARGRHELGHLVATDGDGPPYDVIQYSVRGEEAYFVEMDPDNGTLYIVKPLDREKMSVIRFQAVATDVNNPAFIGLANVTVFVSDVNDHVPQITFPSSGNDSIEITNQVRAGEVITTILATDGDTGQNAVLEYFLTFPKRYGDDLFVIDGETGIVTSRIDLAGVDTQVIHCTAVVKDGGIPALVASANFTIFINATAPAALAMTGGHGLNANITIVIIVVALTLVLVAILVAAIVLVFRKMRRRRDNKPMYTVEKMGELVPKNGQLDIEKQTTKQNCSHEMKPVIKMLDSSRCKEADRESLGSGEGSTTDSGRGASEEGEHGEQERSIASRQNDDDDHQGSNSSLENSSTISKRNTKSKNVTFEDDVMMNESSLDKDASYNSLPYDSCPAISFNSSDSVSFSGLEPWSPEANAGLYNVQAAAHHNVPRRTVRNVKAKDRSKKLDGLMGSIQTESGQMMPSGGSTCSTGYGRDNKRPYHFTDSSSLLRYKAHSNDDSTSEITSAASTTSGSYIIDNDDRRCNC